MEIFEVFKQQKEAKREQFSPSVSERKQKLTDLRDWITVNRKEISVALYEDFKKPEIESDLTEIKTVLAEIDKATRSLKEWMCPQKVKGSSLFLGTRSKIKTEPAGVVLILAPWNFPFNLTIGPLVSAIAAGNSIIIKPSEYTPHVSAIIEKLVKEIYQPHDVYVFNGGPEIAEQLIKLPFDHIFFTGSPVVGKKVMQAAAANLTSVTLELGGQNPLILHSDADLEDAAQKIVYGKCLNTGQSCLSPNCLYLPEELKDPFLQKMKETFVKYYSTAEQLKSNPDYGRIVNEKHFDRISALIEDARQKGAKDIMEGISDRAEKFIPLTILVDLSPDSRILNEEIFGPVLPVVTYKKLEEVYKILDTKEIPLAAYFFGKTGFQEFLSRVRSGAAVLNDTTIHFIHPDLPFGGKGYSGQGKAHGYEGFLSFSYRRPVLRQRIGHTTAKLVYPPYTKKVKRLVEIILKWF